MIIRNCLREQRGRKNIIAKQKTEQEDRVSAEYLIFLPSWKLRVNLQKYHSAKERVNEKNYLLAQCKKKERKEEMQQVLSYMSFL